MLQQQLMALGTDITDAPTTSGAVIQTTINISPDLAEQSTGNPMLFLIARDIKQPRPPLAEREAGIAAISAALRRAGVDVPREGGPLPGDGNRIEPEFPDDLAALCQGLRMALDRPDRLAVAR